MHVILIAVTLLIAGIWVQPAAAETQNLQLVQPSVPPPAVEAVKDRKGSRGCDEGLVLQKNGKCCPPGTNNTRWPQVCVPDGIAEDQIFNGPDGTLFCPGTDMFIVGEKNRWISCAAAGSTPFYSAPRGFAGGEFCRAHGYGYLIRIKPWGGAGCLKIGESRGDGCIEAGTCMFQEGK